MMIIIPCNAGKQHQLCASTHHSQVLNGRDQAKAAAEQNGDNVTEPIVIMVGETEVITD